MSVFLCSTYEDLLEYRNKVMDILMSFRQVYYGMENFGVSQHTPLETCLSNLKEADKVIVLIGTRYGTRDEQTGLSYTELEFAEAKKLHKPLQVYVLDHTKEKVYAHHVATDEQDRMDLARFREHACKDITWEHFTSPEDLSSRIARNLYQEEVTIRKNLELKTNAPPSILEYRETSYDVLAKWYDIWYEDHWKRDEPYKTIVSLIRDYYEAERGKIDKLRILDCACGTGNTFAAFTKEGYEIYGTDGSRSMLYRARENCLNNGINIDRLILDPINWTDWTPYYTKFGRSNLDIVLNTANSICHIPPVDEYMGVALRNFYELLKPGGLLICDTKRYINFGQDDGIDEYREMRFDPGLCEWFIRTEREESCNQHEKGKIKFHTRLLYDEDPAFSKKTKRALIVLTIYGDSVIPRVLVIPYYPLPAKRLQLLMQEVGFQTSVRNANEGKLLNWKYDIVIGQKPL